METLRTENGPQMLHKLTSLEISVLLSLIHYRQRKVSNEWCFTDGWNREATPMKRDDFGVWELTLPANNGHPAIPHGSKIKVSYALQYLLL